MAKQSEIDKMYLDAMADGSNSSKGEYDYLRDNAASEVLNQQIQLANSKEEATRALNKQLASAGMVGSGYAANRQNSIDEAYLKGMQMAQANYGNQLNAIAQQEMKSDAEANASRAEMITGQIGSQTQANALDYMGKYGLSFDNNGNLVSNGTHNFSNDEMIAIQSAYDSKYGFGDLQSALNGIMTNAGNSASDPNWGLGEELKELFKNHSNVENGTVVLLQNGNAGAGAGSAFNNAFLVYRNGRWYQTTKDAYNASNKKIFIKNGKSQTTNLGNV